MSHIPASSYGAQGSGPLTGWRQLPLCAALLRLSRRPQVSNGEVTATNPQSGCGGSQTDRRPSTPCAPSIRIPTRTGTSGVCC